MGLLIIDETKCKKDGICARECPMIIINLKDGDGIPEMVPGGESICNSCGHCVAVCSNGALSHANVPIEKSPLIERDLRISEAQAVQFLRSRRSVRFFKKQPVEKEKLQRLVEIARYAPTGANVQLVEWIVFTDAERIKEIARRTVEWMRKVMEQAPQIAPPYFPLMIGAWDMGYNSVTWSAPALIVASAPKEASTGVVDDDAAEDNGLLYARPGRQSRHSSDRKRKPGGDRQLHTAPARFHAQRAVPFFRGLGDA